ncbi:MFS transporter [Wenjunlia tyrosinilytica]|uniref:Actinorhodin transporter n=1 Tax=Wenjunlia tyrosinilytica TaxID=1544741 RepID=A0A918E0S3_9ACTN|nr:MFS transporter [Wenjunlia tyrosinilytica]GGO95498.1 putative actinorhodin transporter [Wenjunlia tyrosinilytica]
MKPSAVGETGRQAPPPVSPPSTATAQTGPVATGRWLVLVVVLSAVFMQLLDTTITMVALPSLQKDLNATFADIQLVVAIYSLAFACMLVTGGRLGDIYGRKKVFLIGMVGFTLASALCGAAPDATFLIASRLVQGLFSGLMFPQVLSIIQVSFTEKERPKALAFYGATIGLGTVLGPVLGGWLIELDILGTDWRSIFYVNLPIGLLALFLGAVKINESSSPEASRLDPIGTVLLTTGLFLLILPLVIGRENDWPTWSLVSLAVSPLFLIAFFVYEARLTAKPGSSPLVPSGLFKERSFTVGLIISLVFFAGIPSFFMVLFLVLQVGFGYTPVGAGVITLCFALMVAVGSARSASVVKRLGTWTLAIGSGLIMLGMIGIMITLHYSGTDLKGWHLIPVLIVAGAGGGLFLAPCTGIILAGIKSREAGSASGMLATVQQVGAATGVAVAGILFFGLLGSNATHSSGTALPDLRHDLSVSGLPAAEQRNAVAGFQTCFDDRMNQKDLSATPPSCTAIERRVADSPAPPEIKAKVKAAVLEGAVPKARKEDFSLSFQKALYWQVGVFAISMLLVLALPKVKPTETVHAAA